MRIATLLALAMIWDSHAAEAPVPRAVLDVISDRCSSCHGDKPAGGLDFAKLPASFSDPRHRAMWVKVFDRVASNEMPPKNKLAAPEREAFAKSLNDAIIASERARYQSAGRAPQRRLNRREYEYALRDLLGLPWLQIEEALPEDGVAHLFSKSADALDVSHVQMSRYLAAADIALQQAIATPDRPATIAKRYYARDQEAFTRRMFYNTFNKSPERATFPTLEFAGQPDVRSRKAPLSSATVKDREGVGLVCSAYEPVEPNFHAFKAPVSGRYEITLMAHTIWVGPNGASENQKDRPQWFIPNLDDISKGRRDEPVVLYAETPPRQLRRLGAIDITPEPKLHTLTVDLLAGETIRPDAARLFKSRPGNVRWHNPLAEKDGQPGVVYRWLDVKGPIHDSWPPSGQTLLFDTLLIKRSNTGAINVETKNPEADAKRLLARFAERAYRRPLSDADDTRFLPLILNRLKAGAPFHEAMLTGYTAVLCSTEFLYRHESPGPLDGHALAARLSLFLWDSEPDSELRSLARSGKLRDSATLRAQTERMLASPRSERFIESFLDYWLDLRKSGANSPDSMLYNDYYLDDLLADSMLDESRHTMKDIIAKNRPTRSIIDADYVMINERLAKHYDIPGVAGVAIRSVPVPKGNVRGGFLTQASVLTVTANGTTTSPVVRGAWITERILGQPSPPPPPVPAVEPDLRGAVTIREQLAKHRDQASCAVCHNRIDPPGFALESFDVMGGFRKSYRALSTNNRVPGFGVNGQPYVFRNGPPVDCGGQLIDGRQFKDIRELKAHLIKDERLIARNLIQQFVLVATGAPAGIADRDAIEKILNESAKTRYGVRDLIHGVVQSPLFTHK
jgi:hypothetical protein